MLPSALTNPRLLCPRADELASCPSSFFIRSHLRRLRGYGTWERMKCERSHRSREGNSRFQSLSPLELLERNSWSLRCRGWRESEGRGDKSLGILFGGRLGRVVFTWLLPCKSYGQLMRSGPGRSFSLCPLEYGMEEWLVGIYAVREEPLGTSL